MAKNREGKSLLLNGYKEKIQAAGAGGFIAISSDNLDTLTLTNLKKELKATGSEFIVVKNTLLKIALQEINAPLQTQEFDGPTAIVIFKEDPTAPAKLIKKYKQEQKDKEVLSARYAVIDGKYIEKAQVMSLAEIPSKEELLAKLLGSLNAPLSGFMNVITGNAKGFVRVIQQLSEKK